MSIVELETRIAALSPDARAAAARIYAISTTTGTLIPPDEMRPWIEKQFGSVESVASQRIVRVTDVVTLEGALFNEVRSRRPMAVPEKSGAEVAETIRSTENDPFCHPATGTPADDFGRITGEHGVTASNVAKYDGYHGVLVFDQHDPLVPMDSAAIAGHFATARAWAEAAFARDPAAPYYFLMWNCLWRAGGSIVHGHMQMTTTRGMHYPKVERLRRAALAYAAQHGTDYFADLWLVHRSLGLGTEIGGARVFATLTPVKEREVVVLGAPGADEQSIAGPHTLGQSVKGRGDPAGAADEVAGADAQRVAHAQLERPMALERTCANLRSAEVLHHRERHAALVRQPAQQRAALAMPLPGPVRKVEPGHIQPGFQELPEPLLRLRRRPESRERAQRQWREEGRFVTCRDDDKPTRLAQLRCNLGHGLARCHAKGCVQAALGENAVADERCNLWRGAVTARRPGDVEKRLVER